MLKIHLEARNAASNLMRTYHIGLTQDLFGAWIVTTTHGRIGSRGRDNIYAFQTLEEALPKIKAILLKRASAPQRSGCQYQVIEFYQDPYLPHLDVPESLQSSSSVIANIPLKPKKPVFLPLFDIQT